MIFYVGSVDLFYEKNFQFKMDFPTLEEALNKQ